MELNVKIKGFGKVSDANITIKPFTVITGCNASGKSFITRGLYSILHTFNQDMVSVYLINTTNTLDNLLRRISEKLPRASQRDLEQIYNIQTSLITLQQTIGMQFDFLSLLKSDDLLLSFEPDVQQIQSQVETFSQTLRVGKGTKYRAVQFELNQLNSELQDFKQSLSNWSKVYVHSLGFELKRAFSTNFQVEHNAELISNGKEALFTLYSDESNSVEDKPTSVAVHQSGEVSFTANRNLINSAHQLRNIVYLESPIYFKLRTVLKESQINNLSLIRRGALSQVPKYFYDLDRLMSSNFASTPSEKLLTVAEKLERIINGQLIITPRGDILYQETERKAVSLNMASSGISNLGLLALLLRRNVLEEGSFLFIDEPEINLHTTWQHKMLEVLVDLSKAGVNVVMATHSLDMLLRLEYLVSQETKEDSEKHFSVNRLYEDGTTAEQAENVLGDIREAKQVLGAPYIDLLRERLP